MWAASATPAKEQEVAAQRVARPHASSMLEGHHALSSFGVDSSAARPRPSAETNAGAESEALIEISGLSKTYRVRDTAVHALREVDLTVLRGECLAVVGESASGKTTLGRLLLGIEQPTAGTISFAGYAAARRARPRVPSPVAIGAAEPHVDA